MRPNDNVMDGQTGPKFDRLQKDNGARPPFLDRGDGGGRDPADLSLHGSRSPRVLLATLGRVQQEFSFLLHHSIS